jgi:hypothetical protein
MCTRAAIKQRLQETGRVDQPRPPGVSKRATALAKREMYSLNPLQDPHWPTSRRDIPVLPRTEYVEIRPRTCGEDPAWRAQYSFRTIDLGPELSSPSSVPQDCTAEDPAEQEGLTYDVASKGGVPISRIVTLPFMDVTICKHGCSDEGYHKFGGIHQLLWTEIQAATEEGCREFDLGRSDIDNPGLIAFKNRCDSTRSQLTYRRTWHGLPRRLWYCGWSDSPEPTRRRDSSS